MSMFRAVINVPLKKGYELLKIPNLKKFQNSGENIEIVKKSSYGKENVIHTSFVPV